MVSLACSGLKYLTQYSRSLADASHVMTNCEPYTCAVLNSVRQAIPSYIMLPKSVSVSSS